MNLFVISVTTAVFASGFAGLSHDDQTINRPLSEYCAMASLGYELTDNETDHQEDRYSLPEPFNTEVTVNYKLAQSNQLPGVCKLYLATN